MRFKLFVEGRPRPQVRHSTAGGHGYYPSEECKAWRELVHVKALEAMAGAPLMEGPVRVVMWFLVPDNRRGDCSNLAKNVEDSLKDAVYKDDKQIVADKHYIALCPERPGVAILVEPAEMPTVSKARIISHLEGLVW